MRCRRLRRPWCWWKGRQSVWRRVLSEGGSARLDQASELTYILGSLEEPFSSTLGVGDGFLGGKRLGSDDEERSLGVAQLGDFRKIGTVNVGDKVCLQITLRVVLQGFGNHDGSQVGTTDTNVDDRVNRLAGVTLPFTGSNRVGKLLDVVEHTLNLIGALFLDLELLSGRGEHVSQRDVQNSTTFGRVDVFACKHGISERLDLGFPREGQELFKDFRGDQVFGKVEQDSVDVSRGGGLEFPGELLEPVLCGLAKELLEDELLMLQVVELLELLPAGVFCGSVRASARRTFRRRTGSQFSVHCVDCG